MLNDTPSAALFSLPPPSSPTHFVSLKRETVLALEEEAIMVLGATTGHRHIGGDDSGLATRTIGGVKIGFFAVSDSRAVDREEWAVTRTSKGHDTTTPCAFLSSLRHPLATSSSSFDFDSCVR